MSLPQGTEWILIVLVVVLLFGARKLPDAARGIGRSLRIFKSEIKAKDDVEPVEAIEPPTPVTPATYVPPVTYVPPATAAAAQPIAPALPPTVNVVDPTVAPPTAPSDR